MNKIIHGNCLDWLPSIDDNSIDCVYVDPPFMSQKNWGSFDDHWLEDEYYLFVNKVLDLIYPKMRDTASLFWHCDYRTSYHMRVLLNKRFGISNFVNDIVWCYASPSPTKWHFPRKHDNILFYAKGNKRKFYRDRVRIPYKKKLRGRTTIHGTTMLLSEEEIERKTKAGKLVEDWWTDIPTITQEQKGITGYATQKPIKLLDRIIKATTDKGDVVLDCFCGSGTTAVAAKNLEREFIVGDMNKSAIEITMSRTDEEDGNFSNVVAIGTA